MQLFRQSLKEKALECFTSKEIKYLQSLNALAKDFIERLGYNVEFIPDQYSLERIKQNSTESYHVYAYTLEKKGRKG